MPDEDDFDDEDSGGFRRVDPDTSRAAARSISATYLEYVVLRALYFQKGLPQNGWELSLLCGMTTISTVPRIAPLRRKGYIEQRGYRPGPSINPRAQRAYVCTPRGEAFIEAIVSGITAVPKIRKKGGKDVG